MIKITRDFCDKFNGAVVACLMEEGVGSGDCYAETKLTGASSARTKSVGFSVLSVERTTREQRKNELIGNLKSISRIVI